VETARPPPRSLLAYARKIGKIGKKIGAIAPTAEDLGQPTMTDGDLAQILPSLLHVNAVRMLGPDRVGELQAYTFWERTLESLARHPATPGARE
jgi:hypothetical protein